jgi:Tol biopolymer transport system component
VQPDGSKRLLGDYDEAAWSPFGRFVVASRPNELAALEPDGDVRWKLSRPRVRLPRWGGSRTDTRIAYLSGDELRIVGGDGRNDRLLASGVAAVPPAWRPGARFLVTYVAGDSVVAVDAESGRRLWSRAVPGARQLQWSSDGELLLVRGGRTLRAYGVDGRLRHELLRPPAAPVVDAAFAPGGDGLAFVARTADRSEVWTVPRLRPDGSAARRVFTGQGRLTDVAWSPDGKWLVIGWPDAEQWIFARAAGAPRIVAVSNVPHEFESSRLPTVAGWCC